MKRKYYLRGLGLGILITALVFIIAGPDELSDEDVIKRAKELGYVKEESSSLGIKDLLNKETPAPSDTPVPTGMPTPTVTSVPSNTPTPTNMPVPTNTLTPTNTPVPTNTPKPTNTPIPTATPSPKPQPQPTNAPAEVVTAVIVVERGNTATMVCNKIEQAGIVSDGHRLRDYLVKNNLTDYINIGTYTMSSNMSFEDIAKMLTGR